MASLTQQFGLTAEQLQKLHEEKSLSTFQSLGGVKGLASALHVNLQHGIPSSEVSLRAQSFGKNQFKEPPRTSFLELVWEALHDKTLIILIVASIVSLALGLVKEPSTGWIEGTAILGAVVVVVLVTSVNDYSKEKQFRKLSAVRNDKTARVMRDGGKKSEASAKSLVVGDIVLLEAGDHIPADGIFISGHNLSIDESPMTGESDSVRKSNEEPFIISNCQVLDGIGQMLIVCVGEKSEAGRIRSLLAAPAENTPLQEKLEVVADSIGRLGLGTAAATFVALSVKYVIHLFSSSSSSSSFSSLFTWTVASKFIDFFVTAVTIVVVAVPEGLPLAVTLSLAYSMMKMLKDQNLVRHLDACETMGGATCICSDKTGTLTENKMTVTRLWIGNNEYNTREQTPFLKDPLKSPLCEGIAINSTAELEIDEDHNLRQIGSKTECALLGLISEMNVNYSNLRSRIELLTVFPFSSLRKRMTTVMKRQNAKGQHRVYCKGASEVVLRRCNYMLAEDGDVLELTDHKKSDIERNVISAFASNGLRTLGLACRNIEAEKAMDAAEVEEGLILVAVVGIQDPVRMEVPEAVAKCQKAGIVVRMITGDNIDTAKAIAKECGILTEDGTAMEGSTFRKLSDLKVKEQVKSLQVIARSSPADKHRLVSLLREMDEVVAVTGDGTNDAPALKIADVGFAMGITGTEVAKEASDIIIMDDNFASIVRSVMWGRNVYDSIRKFLQFQLTVNLVALILAFVSSLISGVSVLTAVQLLWVNLIMDTMGALALATESPTPDLLERPPYGRNDFLITAPMWVNIVSQAIYQLAVLFLLLLDGKKLVSLVLDEDLSHDVMPTLVFNSFVFLQIFNEINSRRLHFELNVFSGFFTNKVFVAILAITVTVQILIVEFGGGFTSTTHLDWQLWALSVGLGFGSLIVGFFARLFARFLPLPKQTTGEETAPLLPGTAKRYPVFRSLSVALDLSELRRERVQERWQKAFNVVKFVRRARRPHSYYTVSRVFSSESVFVPFPETRTGTGAGSGTALLQESPVSNSGTNDTETQTSDAQLDYSIN